ncbi:FxsA family protein [Larsenimonas suaedae]|uniref:FxsA family protein n=1 Tax=Larsenimonas suaedae TaxID=1851019 RepID=A0ABU1GV57_9GAMM|nr:FxsA family protein [Larsenimonas suaedae]MCM2971182.1 FxsA family protein [Larsenimonas suaedae]MDR5895891.1 FxsA family protein [Larsenimonas suaedae]
MPILFILALLLILDFTALVMLGQQLGFLLTLLWIIGSFAIGTHLIRREGLATLREAQESVMAGQAAPSDTFIQVAAYVFAGVLLILPGPLSDIAGLFMLMPFMRPMVSRKLRERQGVHGAGPTASGQTLDSSTHHTQRHDAQNDQSGTTIEGEYVPKDDDSRR